MVSIHRAPARGRHAHKLAVPFVAMPAIRKSSRQSRTSTPYATPTNNQLPSDEGRGDKTQSFLDSWVEPPPRNPAPSFEDHGFARQGVLETMAPLGARPSHRMKMKARTYPDPPTRRSTSGRNGELLAPDQTVVSTPEMTPAREIERDSERMDDDEVSAGPPTQDPDEDEDDDWVPKKSKGNKPVVKTPVRGKTPVQNKTPSQARTPLKSGTAPSSSMLSTSARKSMPSLLGTDSGTAAGEQKIQIAVNDAVTRAKAHNRPDLIDALRQMHENARSDNGIRVMLEAVIYSNASGEQHKQFSRFIKDVKKRYKRNSRASTVRGARDTTHSDAASNLHSAPLSPSSSPLPAKATNGGSTRSAERFLTNNAASSLPTQLFDPMDISSDNTPVAGQEQAVDAGSAQAHPLSTIPSLAKRSPSPGTRMPSKSPRKHEPSNEGTVVETDAAKEVSTMHATSPDSILGDSDSALSEVDEAVVQNGPPVSPKKTNGTAAAAAPGPKKTLPAQARIGKKSRANSAKPNGRFEKKAPPTAEEKAEEAEIMRRREQMAQQQPVRANYNPPVSDMRFGFEDEMLETESLTDSQIAVGPPMDSSRPRRTGRPSRVSLNLNVGKRMREDSQALSSPQPLISATSTRPTTPAFAPPPAKRLKLTNGGAARTKRS